MGNHAFARDARLSRIYCDGVQSQKGGGLVGDDPWGLAHPDASASWLEGFNDALGGVLDLSCCGYPVEGAQAPELSENRYG